MLQKVNRPNEMLQLREFDQGSLKLLSTSNTTNNVLFPRFLYVTAFIELRKFL